MSYLELLQLFAEGGDGSAPADGGASGVSADSDNAELASIPEKARKFYPKQNVETKQTPKPAEVKTESQEEHPSHLAYEDLIKSDDYKAEHKAYMEKTIGERLKGVNGENAKYKSENSKMRKALETVAVKYGLNPSSETFLDELSSKIDADNSYYEDYAASHDTTPEEARRMDALERRVREAESMKAELEQKRKDDAERAEQQRLISELKARAEQTKAKYPGFNLDVEMQNDAFRRILSATQGDTTAAYIATHSDEILSNAVKTAAVQAQIQTANAIKANGMRPAENGASGTAASSTNIDWRNASLSDIRAFAAEQRRKR